MTSLTDLTPKLPAAEIAQAPVAKEYYGQVLPPDPRLDGMKDSLIRHNRVYNPIRPEMMRDDVRQYYEAAVAAREAGDWITAEAYLEAICDHCFCLPARLSLAYVHAANGASGRERAIALHRETRELTARMRAGTFAPDTGTKEPLKAAHLHFIDSLVCYGLADLIHDKGKGDAGEALKVAQASLHTLETALSALEAEIPPEQCATLLSRRHAVIAALLAETGDMGGARQHLSQGATYAADAGQWKNMLAHLLEDYPSLARLTELR